MELELDINDILNLDNFSGKVPIFPLSNVVLFPNVLLPLHIFENRYRKMLKDALEGEKIITMALLKPGWETQYFNNPQIFDIACMGRIVSTENMPDGRSNIVLYGLKRVKLEEIEVDYPYRMANVSIKEDIIDGNEEIYRKHLEELLNKWNNTLGEDQKDHRIEINTALGLDRLTDSLASLVVSNIFDRQSLLEEQNAVRRAEMIIDYIQTRLDIVNYTSAIREDIIEKRSLN